MSNRADDRRETGADRHDTGAIAPLARGPVWRRWPAWRPLRGLAVAIPVIVLLTFISGAHFYYPVGLISAVFAIGWVPVATWINGSRWRRALAIALIAVNAAVSAVVALPIVPVDRPHRGLGRP